MKPSRFEYFEPTSVPECVGLLREHGEDAKLLAGGQSLVPLMNLRLATPGVLIDLNRVDDLAYMREEGEQLVIGAMTRHRDVAGSETVARACPLLAEAARLIGYPAIRNRGTLGGSLAHADVASEMPCVALTLDAELVAEGPGGRRTIPAREMFLSHFTTALAPDELLVEVRYPRRQENEGMKFLEFSRKNGDFALAAVAADVRPGSTAIGVAGVGERPWRATRAEQRMVAGGAIEDAARDAGTQAAEMTDSYRAHVVETLVGRALNAATEGLR